MGCSKRSLIVVAAMAFSSACGVEAAPSEMTAAHRTALADTLLAEADRFADALSRLDGAHFGTLFTDQPDLTYIDHGRIYADKEALIAAASGFFGRTERLEGRWHPARVVILGPDAGVFTGVFHGEYEFVEGKAWTFAYRRAPGGGWEIVHAHETNMPPGRLDLYR